jgi:hypothetical protein
MSDGLEKRKFQRLECPLDVAVEIVSVREMPKGLPGLSVKSRNISKGGICLETVSIDVDGVNLLSGSPFARENRLYLSIKLTPEEPPIMATGEVRWYDIAHDIPEPNCCLGVAFTEIEEGEKDRLVRFLKQHRGFI